MSTQKSRKRDIGDDAARTRKILAKVEQNRVSGFHKRTTTLVENTAQIGPHFVIGITHPGGHEQFTVCRPIGYTDLDADEDWTIIPTDQIPSTLKRKDDPGAGELNQKRSQKRTDLAVANGNLIKKTIDGHAVMFYPHDSEVPRNTHLEQANREYKSARDKLSLRLKSTTDKDEVKILKQELSQVGSLHRFLNEECAQAEKKIREFWSTSTVADAVESAFPRSYRTLTGPYGDLEQRAVYGARGLTLQSVIDALSRGILDMDISESEPALNAVSAPSGATSSLKSGKGSNSIKERIKGTILSTKAKGKEDSPPAQPEKPKSVS